MCRITEQQSGSSSSGYHYGEDYAGTNKISRVEGKFQMIIKEIEAS
jgi:hypothetical protein